jgi:hypothetical protein
MHHQVNAILLVMVVNHAKLIMVGGLRHSVHQLVLAEKMGQV